MRWIVRRFISRGWFRKIDQTGYYRNHHYRINRLVVDEIHRYFTDWSRRGSFISLMARLAQSADLDLAYQKILAFELYRLHRCATILAGMGSGKGGHPPVFVPEPSFYSLAGTPLFDSAFPPDVPVRFSRLSYLARALVSIERLKWTGILLLYPFYILARIGFPSIRPAVPEQFQLGIRSYDSDWGFRYRYRTIDFLLDGSLLSGRNCLFCIDGRLSDSYRKQFREHGYRTVDMNGILDRADLPFVRQTVLGEILPVWGRLVLHSWKEPLFMLRGTLEFLDVYLRWSYFSRIFRIHHYIVYNDFLPAEIIRNIVLREHGAESWFYEHSCNYSFVTFPPGSDFLPHLAEAFTNYDHMVTWGNFLIRYNQMMPNKIRKFENVGCLWSEHIVSISRDGARNRFLTDLSQWSRPLAGRPIQVIGVFDTTVDPSTPLQFEDIVRFFDDMLGLLDAFPDIILIFKNKWKQQALLDLEPRLGSVLQRIKRTPRCFLIADQDYDSAEVIAASDLIISACFTAPTVEALGAGKKAFFHDATNKFPQSYYAKFPNFVSHSFPELRECVELWLYKTTREQFATYLDTHIREEVEASLKGDAITRLRELLVKPGLE